MADAEDLKSSGDFSSCGFDSHPGHQSFLLKMNELLSPARLHSWRSLVILAVANISDCERSATKDIFLIGRTAMFDKLRPAATWFQGPP